MNTRIALALFLCLPAAGCKDDAAAPAEEESLTPSTRNALIWKRYQAVENDLMAALELGRDEVCTELGQASCVQTVHRVALGGHDPFATGLYQPLARPLATTPLAIDRVVLSACIRRVELDAGGEARIFVKDRTLDLAGEAPSASDPAVEKTVVALYRRLLARDPSPEELEIVGELTVDDDGAPVSARDFAVLACHAIGTTSEFLFL